MGKIFGISDVPVTLFTPIWEPMRIPAPYRPELPRKICGESFMKANVHILQSKAAKKGFFNRIINGFKKII